MEISSENKELRLDNRHLLLFFLGAVLICAGFFALGFWMGHGQTGEAIRVVGDGKHSGLAGSKVANATAGVKSPQASDPTDMRKDLDFYSAVTDQSLDENFSPRLSDKKAKEEQRKPSSLRRGSSGPTVSSSELIHLQVAALRNRSDANRLADELRGKGYPVVVVAASKSEEPQWIRVKVGPFRNTRKTAQVKARLARDGFESILRR